jgi:hypothetical protein
MCCLIMHHKDKGHIKPTGVILKITPALTGLQLTSGGNGLRIANLVARW